MRTGAITLAHTPVNRQDLHLGRLFAIPALPTGNFRLFVPNQAPQAHPVSVSDPDFSVATAELSPSSSLFGISVRFT